MIKEAEYQGELIGPGTGEGGGPCIPGLRKNDLSVVGDAGGDSSWSP